MFQSSWNKMPAYLGCVFIDVLYLALQNLMYKTDVKYKSPSF